MPSPACRAVCVAAAIGCGLTGVSAGQPPIGAGGPARSAPVPIVDAATFPFLQDQWTTENGLPQNSVTALVQTRDGYLWVGTSGGLARFDGVRFTVFNSLNTPALQSNRILALHEDGDGTLWIGTEHAGLVGLKNATFTRLSTADGLPEDSVSKITPGRDGSVWLFTLRDAVRLRGGRIVAKLGKHGLPSAPIQSIAEDARGVMWVGSTAGVTRVDGATSTTFTTRDGLPHHRVDEIAIGPDGAVWLATFAGLARADGDRLVAYVPPADAPRRVRSPFVTAAGDVWVPNENAVLHVRGEAAIRYAPKNLDGATAVALVDREGTIWIGTHRSGLLRWKQPVVSSLGRTDGLAGQGAMSVYEDRDGTTWVGNWCGGLSRFRDGRFAGRLTLSSIDDVCVTSILRTRDGTLWVATPGGLFRQQGRTADDFAMDSRLPEGSVSALYEDRAGTLWVGANGLARRDGDRWTVFTTRDGLVDNDVRFLAEDAAGALWIGTTGGLGRFDGTRFTPYTTADGLSHNFVRAIHHDADGTVWLGTYGGGLTRFKDGRFTAITTREGLFDDVVSRILEDDRGNFWMSGNRGIFRASRAELHAVANGRIKRVTSIGYGIADGMSVSETNGGGQPAGWRTSDGRLWFPTIAGVAVVDPRRFNEVPPPVAIEEVRIDQTPVPSREEIDLPAGARNLEIQYTALSLAAPEKVRFRYRLEGYDEDWIEADRRRTAYYTAVPPGRYRFHVIAANNDGVWNETGAALSVVQQPRVYQTWWFLAGCVAMAALTVLAGHRVRVRALTRRTRELEAHVAARTAEVVEQKNHLSDANVRLEEANVELQRARDDLLATYDRLRVGVLVVDRSGRVTFVSRAARPVLSVDAERATGRRWLDVLPLGEDDRQRLGAILGAPRERRAKVPVRFTSDPRHHYWMELEIEDDPRDRERRIVFLYDVTEIYDLRRLLDDQARFHGLIGQSAAMQLLYKQISDVAAVDTTVLIEGETGTGKELVARAIHYASARKGRPFVPVNCAGLTESLLASQLFGHRRGAFTGAVTDQIGHFEAAGGGTIFLDEIGEIPPSVQMTLLRVLEQKEIARLGEAHPRKIDVRVVAATNRDLTREVAEGRFRQDLFYRVRVTTISVPPLRERRDDTPVLAAWLLSESRRTTGRSVHDISAEAMEILVEHPWPGNVRELRSAIETAVIHAHSTVIQPADLPREILGASEPVAADRDAAERERLLEAFRRADGNRTEMARLLGISRATLYRRLASLNLELENTL